MGDILLDSHTCVLGSFLCCLVESAQDYCVLRITVYSRALPWTGPIRNMGPAGSIGFRWPVHGPEIAWRSGVLCLVSAHFFHSYSVDSVAVSSWTLTPQDAPGVVAGVQHSL